MKVETVTEDFNAERRERENMASRHADQHGKWTVHMLELKEEKEKLVEEWRMPAHELKEDKEKLEEDLKNVNAEKNYLAHEAEQREFQLTKKLDGAVQLQQETDEKCLELREERDVIKMELNRVAEKYERKGKSATDLEGENRHLQVHMSDLQGQVSELQEKLQVVLVEKESMEDHIRHLEDEKIKNEKLHEMTAALNRELKLEIQEVTKNLTAEKEQILSQLHVMDQQRKHDYAEWQSDKTSLENAIADITRLSDENMLLTQQLKQAQDEVKLWKESADSRQTVITSLTNKLVSNRIAVAIFLIF